MAVLLLCGRETSKFCCVPAVQWSVGCASGQVKLFVRMEAVPRLSWMARRFLEQRNAGRSRKSIVRSRREKRESGNNVLA
jgi:hypothetical protein